MIARASDATVALVGFSGNANWLPQWSMQAAFDAAGVEVLRLDPDPLEIAGAAFDPIEHVRAWQAFYGAAVADKQNRKMAIPSMSSMMAR